MGVADPQAVAVAIEDAHRSAGFTPILRNRADQLRERLVTALEDTSSATREEAVGSRRTPGKGREAFAYAEAVYGDGLPDPDKDPDDDVARAAHDKIVQKVGTALRSERLQVAVHDELGDGHWVTSSKRKDGKVVHYIATSAELIDSEFMHAELRRQRAASIRFGNRVNLLIETRPTDADRFQATLKEGLERTALATKTAAGVRELEAGE